MSAIIDWIKYDCIVLEIITLLKNSKIVKDKTGKYPNSFFYSIKKYYPIGYESLTGTLFIRYGFIDSFVNKYYINYPTSREIILQTFIKITPYQVKNIKII
jgi:hypothetical protein